MCNGGVSLNALFITLVLVDLVDEHAQRILKKISTLGKLTFTVFLFIKFIVCRNFYYWIFIDIKNILHAINSIIKVQTKIALRVY